MPYRRTILVIDDDRDILDLIAETLRDEGYRLLAVASQEEALQYLTAFRFGLIIADAPGQTVADRWDGLDAVRRAADDTPLIICSAHTAASCEGHAERGIIGLLPKPFDLDELLAIVREHLPAPEPGNAPPFEPLTA